MFVQSAVVLAATALVAFAVPFVDIAPAPSPATAQPAPQGQGGPVLPCECVYGYWWQKPPGSTSYWAFVAKPMLQDGMCDAPFPPCEEIGGCTFDYVISYLNRSGSLQEVIVTLPGGARSKMLLPNNQQWSNWFTCDASCGQNLQVDVSDGAQGLVICSACQYDE